MWQCQQALRMKSSNFYQTVEIRKKQRREVKKCPENNLFFWQKSHWIWDGLHLSELERSRFHWERIDVWLGGDFGHTCQECSIPKCTESSYFPWAVLPEWPCCWMQHLNYEHTLTFQESAWFGIEWTAANLSCHDYSTLFVWSFGRVMLQPGSFGVVSSC